LSITPPRAPARASPTAIWIPSTAEVSRRKAPPRPESITWAVRSATPPAPSIAAESAGKSLLASFNAPEAARAPNRDCAKPKRSALPIRPMAAPTSART